MKNIILIAYSGHSYVVHDILTSSNYIVLGYCDDEEKKFNPFNLAYLGTENCQKNLLKLQENDYFIAVGNNSIRQKIYLNLISQGIPAPINAIHFHSIISNSVELGNGIMIAARVTINALATIGNGVICNTGCIIEHECQIEDFVHIAPGAVLCGNVKVGENSFIGADSVVKQGIKIGKNVIVGAGSVVIKDIPDNVIVAGNPAKVLNQK